MYLSDLDLTSFRNYDHITLNFSFGGAIFEGENGSGKTNILESIYLLCTGRSQRGAKRSEMIKFSEMNSFIEGRFVDNQKVISASIGFSRDKQIVLRNNGNVISSFSEWFGKRPVVSFGSDDLYLVRGAPEERRKFIDILGSQIDSKYLTTLISYRHSLSCRNKILTENFDKIQCEIYEEQMAETGSEICIKRKEILSVISPFFTSFYDEISGEKEKAEITYNPSILCDCSSKKEWKNVFYEMLREQRKKDIEKGFSSIGPHRDDISFFLDKKPAKNFGSQGQCRSIVLSLKLSSVECIEKYRQDGMIFLIDDAVSELDKFRTERVFTLIENRGQIFIATPFINGKPNKDMKKFSVSSGKIIEI